jgi:hypothetical protein
MKEIEIIQTELIENLYNDLDNGAIIDEKGTRLLLEHYVDSIKGRKIEIFSNEHPPPHFTITYQGKSDSFNIETCEPLHNTLGNFKRNIKKWWLINKDNLIDIWNSTRPTDCTVGKIIIKEKI